MSQRAADAGPEGPVESGDGLGLEDSGTTIGSLLKNKGSNFYDTFARDPTANYVPSGARRNVGTGVAVQETPQIDFSRFGLGDVSSLYSNLLGRQASPEEIRSSQEVFGSTIDQGEIDRFLAGAQGGDLPSAQTALDYLNRTGDEAGARNILEASAGTRPLTRDILSLYRPEAESRIQGAISDLDQRIAAQRDMQPSRERQQQLASYGPGSLQSMLATGYNQLFGRDIDPAGANYFLNQLGGQNLDQAAVNRILLGGAQGADREAAQDYQLSLTGGRPDYEARMAQGLSPQYMQPIYRSSYQDYLQPGKAPAASSFSPGFNPFDYTSPPSATRLDQIKTAMNPFFTATPVTGPTASFDTYTGYNPFSPGAVNPYATRMQPNRPVGEGVAVQRQVAADLRGKMASTMPNANPYFSSYMRAYAKGGGIGFE